MPKRRNARLLRAGLVAVALVLSGFVPSTEPVAAQTNPYQRGPTPTLAGLNADAGPFAIQTVTVARQTTFAGGTIHYPTDTSQGTYGALVVTPGFLMPQSSIQWTGPRIASHGFVVFTLDTLTPFDFPGQRAEQMRAALNYLTQQSPTVVRSRIDPTRLAAMGWSMGGGGTLELAQSGNPALQAIVPLQPWDLASFGNVRVPTLIVGAEADFIAPVAQHAEPFYESIPAASEKAYVEVAGADHFLATRPEATQARMSVVWLKRYVDNDTRYEPFMCPPPSGPTIREYRHTCPG